MTVSVCGSQDIPRLAASAEALIAEDGGNHDPFMDTGWAAREGTAYYKSLVADDRCLCLLAPDGEGHLVGRLRDPHSLRPRAVTAVLESMRVGAGRRRGGVGAELVATFFAWARENGANEVTVRAYAANGGALEFYRAQGFEPHEVILRRG
jgi:GNAT superfamily N-acetyltransferase